MIKKNVSTSQIVKDLVLNNQAPRALIILMGISGSGKSTLTKSLEDYLNDIDLGITVICPDHYRRDIVGSVTDQSRDKEVWKKVYEDLDNSLENLLINFIIFDATNISGRTRKTLRKKAQEYNIDTVLIYTEDSYDVELCNSRVRGDIDAGRDRSNVPEEVIKNQHNRFVQAMINIEKEGYRDIYGWNGGVF